MLASNYGTKLHQVAMVFKFEGVYIANLGVK